MIEVEAGELKRAVESQHGCTATLAQSVPVKETFGGKTVWHGVVHVFKIHGHPKATQAYAWSSPIEGSDKRRFFAVLHVPPITSPSDAVRAAIIAEAKAKKKWLKKKRESIHPYPRRLGTSHHLWICPARQEITKLGQKMPKGRGKFLSAEQSHLVHMSELCFTGRKWRCLR